MIDLSKSNKTMNQLLKEDAFLDQLPPYLDQEITDWRESVEIYRLVRSGIKPAEVARMKQTSPQNINSRLNTVKKRLEEMGEPMDQQDMADGIAIKEMDDKDNG